MLHRTLFVLLFVGGAASAWAEDAGPDAPVSPAARFEQLIDLRSNVGLVKQPRQALDLADAMTDPEFLAAVMVMSANPEIWLKAMEHAGAPGVPQNLAQLANPEMLADWFYSSIDPQFQQAVLSRMLDPKKSQRWMQAMSDPRFYMSALAVISPDTPTQWVKVSADGRMLRSMQTSCNPQAYLSWMRLPIPAAPARKQSGDKGLSPGAYTTKPPLRF